MSILHVNFCVLGDKGVGRSSLIGQYCQNTFPSSSVDGTKIENIDGNLTKLRVLNFGWEGSILVFDLTNRTTFDNLAQSMTYTPSQVLVGNKCDLVEQRVVSREEAEQVAAAHGMKYFETTATDHHSTRAPFLHVVREVVKAREAGMPPLVRAASAGDVAAVQQIAHQQIDQIDVPDDGGLTAMHHAAKNGHTSVIEELVRLGSKAIDTGALDGWTPMHMAAEYGHPHVIELLVRLGSKAIDTDHNDGRTPMFEAASSGHVSVIETLVRLGSKAIDTPDNDGWTPFSAAAMSGHVSVIEELVRLGSKAIDTPSNDGRTPMYAAAMNGHASVIEMLVRLGSKAIDTPNNNGWTPMLVAASSGHASVIEMLVRLGSKAIDTSNGLGRTPLSLASQNHLDRQFACPKLLKALGSDPTSPFKVFDWYQQQQIIVLTDDTVLEVRYRVYFSHSLVHQLLRQLDILSVTKPSATQARIQTHQ